MIALNLNSGPNFIHTHKFIQIEINFIINTGSLPLQKDTINYWWCSSLCRVVYVFSPSSSQSASDNAACTNQIPGRCVSNHSMLVLPAPRKTLPLSLLIKQNTEGHLFARVELEYSLLSSASSFHPTHHQTLPDISPAGRVRQLPFFFFF